MVEPTIDRFRLIALREARGLTQGQLAVKSGVAQAHLSRLETGKRTNVKVSTLQKLASALGVQPEDLMVKLRRLPGTEKAPIDLANPRLQIVLQKIAELPPEDQQMIIDVISPIIERDERLRKERERRKPEGEG